MHHEKYDFHSKCHILTQWMRYLREKFSAGTVADIGFFAGSTVAMMSSLDLQQGRNEALLKGAPGAVL